MELLLRRRPSADLSSYCREQFPMEGRRMHRKDVRRISNRDNGVIKVSKVPASEMQALILVLFPPGRPSDISWGVVTVIVDAVKGMLWRRSRSYFGKKGREVSQPFSVHRDPATAIVRVSRVGFLFASIAGVEPSLIFRRFTQAVRRGSGGGQFSRQTATASRETASQIAAKRDDGYAAIAAAFPSSLALIRRALYNKQPSESLALEIG